MNDKIFVIGCGRWGSFIAWYLNKIGLDTTLYGRKSSKNMQKLISERKNDYIEIPLSLKLDTNIENAKNANIIVISVNAQGFRTVCNELKEENIENKTIVLCMKGIEIETGKRLSEIATEILSPTNKIAVWLGPGHVQSFYKGIPNCMVIDSEDTEITKYLIGIFSSNLIRFYYGRDLIGNEIGAASKNVIGIAAGLLDGYNLTSLKGPLMARAPREIARLIVKLGGKEITAYGLCHLGDYEATLFSENSHNRKFGECFAKNEKFDYLAEGYYTVKAIVELAKKHNIDLPICEAVYNMIYNKTDCATTLNNLFSRKIKNEFE